jgi:HlyD family secretion protein
MRRSFLAPLLVLAFVLAVGGPVVATLRGSRSRPGNIPTVKVRRADVDGSILAAGRVASSQSTEIRCMLERLNLPGQGGSLASGASTILSLVPEGSTVKTGDVLCEMDASDYTELVRRQQIVVEQTGADRMQASLALDVAKITLQAYREGEQIQVERDFLGQIALAKADLARQADRLDWSRRMLEKGYTSLAQVRGDELAQARIATALAQAELALANYKRFTTPKDFLVLRSQVVSAQSALDFQTIRLKREQERLAHYKELVERCTVRAPHGGYVVYANRPGREPRVYLGAPVRERMRLFTLPDQSKMEVEVLLHETIVARVHPEMAANIRVEALPDEVLEGDLASIAPVPLSDQSQDSGNDVTYFLGHVRLETLPPRLRPGMTAEVTISTGLRRGVLAVPASTVMLEDDQEICYVDHDDSVERRAVKVSQATRDLLEVVDGLNEGEEVILHPSLVQTELSR